MSEQLRVYVGTYTKYPPYARGRAEGIYLYHFDQDRGSLTPAGTTSEIVNPSFLAEHPNGRFLYAVNEAPELDGREGGGVSAFAVDEGTGALTFLNQQPSHGADPCHLCVDREGRFVFVANYSSGSVAVYPIGTDGTLGPASHVVQHRGGSRVDPHRQDGPHAHQVTLTADDRFLLVNDLGLDRTLIYRPDWASGRLNPHDPAGVDLPPGAGPRHLAFHPDAPFVSIINELGSSVTTCAWDASRGTLRALQTVSTLPANFTGTSTCADIHVAPSGRFVYGSNRGHDSIAIFAVDRDSGTLTPVGHQATGGQTPRNFALDPSGNYLLAANQGADSITIFRVDGERGLLEATNQAVPVPSPVCLIFAGAAD